MGAHPELPSTICNQLLTQEYSNQRARQAPIPNAQLTRKNTQVSKVHLVKSTGREGTGGDRATSLPFSQYITA